MTVEFKTCPMCGEEVRLEENQCRFCQYRFDVGDAAEAGFAASLEEDDPPDPPDATRLSHSVKIALSIALAIVFVILIVLALLAIIGDQELQRGGASAEKLADDFRVHQLDLLEAPHLPDGVELLNGEAVATSADAVI